MMCVGVSSHALSGENIGVSPLSPTQCYEHRITLLILLAEPEFRYTQSTAERIREATYPASA